MKKKYLLSVLVISLFFVVKCGDNNQDDGGDKNQVYTGILDLKVSYGEPLSITRELRIWVIKQRDIEDQDCMRPSLNPEEYPVVNSTTMEYTREDYNNQVSPEWETELPQDTYSIICHGFDENSSLVAIGCLRDIFIPGEGRTEVNLHLYYNR